MSWRYGVVRSKDGTLGVHEIYLTKAGKVWAIAEDPIIGPYSTEDEILSDLRMMTCDIEAYPILDRDLMVFVEPDFVHAL